MHRLARILQGLHYLGRLLKEVCFWTHLARFLQEMHFCSTRVPLRHILLETDFKSYQTVRFQILVVVSTIYYF